MTKDYWDLSDKISLEELDLYSAVFHKLTGLNVPFLIVGATARDLSIRYFNAAKTRATKDIDFGVEVGSWREYETIRQGLIQSGHFNKASNKHRLIHKTGVPIDIIPFGQIADENLEITWPPENTSRMSILGFDEAYKYSQKVLIKDKDKSIELKFATPLGLIILKLIAWQDNPQERKRDAGDILHLIEWYLELGNLDRLIEKNADILNIEGYSNFLGAARLLGRDINKITLPKTKEKILQIITSQIESEDKLLVEHILSLGSSYSFESIKGMLQQLKEGICD